MPAFNFDKRFADKVATGEKRCTIRKTMRCKVGDKLTFYTGQRTKNCRKIGSGDCIGIAEISVGREDEWGNLIPWAFRGWVGMVLPNITPRGLQPSLHQRLGFMNIKEMVAFYEQHHGLPFHGWLHVWEPDKEEQ